MDSVDPIKRSAIMRSIRQKNTGPEMALRQGLPPWPGPAIPSACEGSAGQTGHRFQEAPSLRLRARLLLASARMLEDDDAQIQRGLLDREIPGEPGAGPQGGGHAARGRLARRDRMGVRPDRKGGPLGMRRVRGPMAGRRRADRRLPGPGRQAAPCKASPDGHADDLPRDRTLVLKAFLGGEGRTVPATARPGGLLLQRVPVPGGPAHRGGLLASRLPRASPSLGRARSSHAGRVAGRNRPPFAWRMSSSGRGGR